MIVTFCGHARFVKSEEYEKKILSFLEETVADQAADMYLGGYGEFDNFAYDCCKKYKRSHPQISLVFVAPYLTVEYQKNHLVYYKNMYDSILYSEIEDKPIKFAILYRNRYMVERADHVVAYIDHCWGGAYKTYQYAKKIGKSILNLRMSEDNSPFPI